MPALPRLKLPDVVSIVFETNGKGYLGFIVELPGAFVRGKTKNEAIAKVNQEVNLYLKWLNMEKKRDYNVKVVQMHRSSLMVEDADNEILLEADKETMDEEEFKDLLNLAWFSGETFLRLYTSTKFKDWADDARIRKTFYGDNLTTIQEICDHVKGCQYYYLSRTGYEFEEKEEGFMETGKFCTEKIRELYYKNNNSIVFDVDNELWTLKKILRRFIWHDRIHGKAMTRILEKQRQLGMIDGYDDPFHFMDVTSYNKK